MKTESAIGCTIRAIEHGDNVLFVQFLKNGSSLEIEFFKEFKRVDVLVGDVNKITLPSNLTTVDKFNAQVLFEEMVKSIAYNKPDLVVADELLPAVDMGLITEEQLVYLISKCNEVGSDLFMTGRVRQKSLRLKIAEVSDICTDARCITHNFNTHCDKCGNDHKYHYTFCPDCGSELRQSQPPKKGRDM